MSKIKEIFVIMPSSRLIFSNEKGRRIYEKQYFDDLYRIIADASSSINPDVQCRRSIVKSGDIKADIIRNLSSADIVIAVVTGRSSNIFWQLGIRHALKKGTIILQDRSDESPLGLVGYSAYPYQIDNPKGIENLKDFIVDKLNVYENAFLSDSPVQNILGQDLTEFVNIGANRIDIFISYSSRDREEGMTIAEKAEKRKLLVFLDKKDIEYGAEFGEEIRYNLLRSREICVLITPEALRSEWITTEWGAAWALKKPITPILLRCSESQLPDRLRRYQYVDFHKIDNYLDQVVKRKNVQKS